jgi:hypothetical protein
MSLPATESFTGTGSLSGSWTQQKNSISRSSDQGKADVDLDDSYAIWTADSFSNDQYSQVKVISYGGDYIELPARGSGSNNDYILYWQSMTSIVISKWVAGVQTDLQDTGVTATANDVIKLECVGTSIKAYKNGAQIGTTVTDSSLASGSAGCGGYGQAARFDDWEGGNVGAATGLPFFMQDYLMHGHIQQLSGGIQ